MKQSSLLIISVISILIISCAHHQNSESSLNEEAIKKEIALANEGFWDAWENGDADKCMSYMTADYKNMPAIDVTTDFQATREMFQNAVASNIVSNLDYKQIEIFVHENMAYEFGWLDQTLIIKESRDTINTHARFITVWKKLDDGMWKFHRWMAQQESSVLNQLLE